MEIEANTLVSSVEPNTPPETTVRQGYRPEIDGLRAISVLGVIGFHSNGMLPGGFVGVDVFFVISGFLITSIIQRQTEERTFSLVNFWERRIKRILPSATLVVSLTLIFGTFALLEDDRRDLAASACSHALMSSNIYFWRTAGYFAGAAESKPLMHTWSLAVEEQFYIIYPILLISIQRMSRPRQVLLLAIIAVGSLAIAALTVTSYPVATFFLLPTRAWELMAGGILAVGACSWRPSRTQAQIFGMIGILLILIPMFIYSKNTVFPGPTAAPPVLGAVLVIWATHGQRTIIQKILSSRALVTCGLLSYPLYLWHWPIFVFMGILATPSAPIGIGLSFLLAYFSWKYVETPLRHAKTGQTMVFCCAVGSTAVSLALSAWSFNSNHNKLPEDLVWQNQRYNYQVGEAEDEVPILGVTSINDSIDFVLAGDSIALCMAETFDSIAYASAQSGLCMARDGIDLFASPAGSNSRRESERGLASILEVCRTRRPKAVFLSCSWQGHITDKNRVETARTSINEFCDALSLMGVRVVLIGPICKHPGTPQEWKTKAYYASEYAGRIPADRYDHWMHSTAGFRDIVSSLPPDRFDAIHLGNILFRESGDARVFENQRFLYYDNAHLSVYGAQQILSAELKRQMELYLQQ